MSVECRIEGPEYLDPRELYGLGAGEKVLYFIHPNQTWAELNIRELSEKGIDEDPRVQELFACAQEEAKRIESGSAIAESGSMAVELQGRFKDVRVVPARDPVMGRRVKGWTLIGVKKDPQAILFGDKFT